MDAKRVNNFLHDITAWAKRQADVKGVALVGSHARSEARPDSDVDLILICARPADYLTDLSWMLQFGDVRDDQLEDYGKVTSVRVWYRDGLEVEYGITDEDWAALPPDEGTQQVILDGMVVLYEQGGLLSRHQTASEQGRPVTNSG